MSLYIRARWRPWNGREFGPLESRTFRLLVVAPNERGYVRCADGVSVHWRAVIEVL